MSNYPGKLKFKAAQQAFDMFHEQFPGYATYIQNSLEESIAKGIRTIEEVEAMNLGDCFIGNEGN
jgi:hypothetical protein